MVKNIPNTYIDNTGIIEYYLVTKGDGICLKITVGMDVENAELKLERPCTSGHILNDIMYTKC